MIKKKKNKCANDSFHHNFRMCAFFLEQCKIIYGVTLSMKRDVCTKSCH